MTMTTGPRAAIRTSSVRAARATLRFGPRGHSIVIVDAHLHVWDETAAGRDPGPMPVGYSPQSVASVELFLDYMDEAGVDRAVFVQPWFYHGDNTYMVRSAERFPDRFRAVCVVEPYGPDAPAALRHPRARGPTGTRPRGPRPGPRVPVRPSCVGTAEPLARWEPRADAGTMD